jgi:anti-sigma factor RsiW
MPWFDGRIDFAPPVKNLAAQGFPLQGGRLDYIGGRPVAALVYFVQQHPLELFIFPDSHVKDSEPVRETHNGYSLVHWNEQEMSLWVVSDSSPHRLQEFVNLWRNTP